MEVTIPLINTGYRIKNLLRHESLVPTSKQPCLLFVPRPLCSRACTSGCPIETEFQSQGHSSKQIKVEKLRPIEVS